MGGSFLAHHAGCDNKNFTAGEFHFIELSWFEDLEVEHFSEHEVGVLAMGAVRLEIVNFGEDTSEAADIKRLAGDFAFEHEEMKLGENFLVATEGEDRDENTAAAGEDTLDALGEALGLGFAGDAGNAAAIAAGCFHNEDVGIDILEARGFEDGLVVEADITCVEESLLVAANHEAGGAEGMAGIEELEGGGREAGAGFVESGPIDLAIIFVTLEKMGGIVDLLVGVEGVFVDAEFVALADHYVDGIVEDALDQEIAELGHEDVSTGPMAESDREGADVVVMAMSDDDGVDLLLLNEVEHGKTFAAFAFWMHAGIHQHSVTFQIDKPGAGADVGVRIQIDNPHNP